MYNNSIISIYDDLSVHHNVLTCALKQQLRITKMSTQNTDHSLIFTFFYFAIFSFMPCWLLYITKHYLSCEYNSPVLEKGVSNTIKWATIYVTF